MGSPIAERTVIAATAILLMLPIILLLGFVLAVLP